MTSVISSSNSSRFFKPENDRWQSSAYVCCTDRKRELVRGSTAGSRSRRGCREPGGIGSRINPLASPGLAFRPVALQATSQATTGHAQVSGLFFSENHALIMTTIDNDEYWKEIVILGNFESIIYDSEMLFDPLNEKFWSVRYFIWIYICI